MKKLIALVLALVCMSGLVGCGNNMEDKTEAVVPDGGAVIPDGGDVIPNYENNELSSGRGWYGDLPKGLRPMVMVNSKLYRWTGMSKVYLFGDSGVYTMGDASTFLPDGYTALGEISGITEEVPFEELQLRAGFEATGTVFTNEQTPEAVYVLMTTSWFSNYYIRFVSDDLYDNECISYQGRQYRFNVNTDICEITKDLPEECVLIGTLRYIGSDIIPLNDLETNRIADSYSKFLDGREVYVDPSDYSVLYVYEHQYWAQGDYPAWRVCQLWAEYVK